MKECQYCGVDEGEFHKPLCPITQFRQAQNAYVEPTDAAKNMIIARLTRERDEALAEVERLREDHKYACDVADNLRAEIKTLRNQAVANTEDAERYRWLRTFATWVNEDYESIHYRWNAGEFESVDAAIDAVMREGD